MKSILLKQLKKIPQTSGVYLFYNDQNQILYIGKAVRLKDRVRTYFTENFDLLPHIKIMVSKIASIKWINTDSEIEALLLEAEMIKRYKPRYNKDLRDDKSYLYLGISKEDYPRVFFARRPQLDTKLNSYFGPYPSAANLRKALRYLRRIFPYRTCGKIPHKADLWYQMYHLSSPCDGSMPKKEYRKIINQLKQFLKGKKKKIINNLKKEMNENVTKKQFEVAANLRDRIIALDHLHEAVLVPDTMSGIKNLPKRIECYDVSNISGKYATGSMVVFENGEPNSDEYKRFKIKGVSQVNDIAMLAEVLHRRFRHKEWAYPNLLVIDGGIAQLNVTRKIILEEINLNIPIIAIAKGHNRKGKKLLFAGPHILIHEKLILRLRDEAHRFAILYHKLLRKKGVQDAN